MKKLILLLLLPALFCAASNVSALIQVDKDVRLIINDTSTIRTDLAYLDINANAWSRYNIDFDATDYEDVSYNMEQYYRTLQVVSVFQTLDALYIYLYIDSSNFFQANDFYGLHVTDDEGTSINRYRMERVSSTGFIYKFRVNNWNIINDEEIIIADFYQKQFASPIPMDGTSIIWNAIPYWAPFHLLIQEQGDKINYAYYQEEVMYARGKIVRETMQEAAYWGDWLSFVRPNRTLFVFKFDLINPRTLQVDTSIRDRLIGADVYYRLRKMERYEVLTSLPPLVTTYIIERTEYINQSIIDEKVEYRYKDRTWTNIFAFIEAKTVTRTIRSLGAVYDEENTPEMIAKYEGHTYRVYFGDLENGYESSIVTDLISRRTTWWETDFFEMHQVRFYDSDEDLYYSIDITQTMWTSGGEDTGPQPGDTRANDSTWDKIVKFINDLFDAIWDYSQILGIILIIIVAVIVIIPVFNLISGIIKLVSTKGR